jgi:hypothetical protein
MTTSGKQSDNGRDFESQCPFPAAVLYEDEVNVYDAAEHYVVCRLVDIRAGQRGRFARSQLIDANGNCWQVDGARVVCGVGPFWGWNLLLSRTVRIRPNLIAGPTPVSIEALRGEVLKRLSRRDSLTITLRSFCTTIAAAATRRLTSRIQGATSAQDLIAILLSADFPERKETMSETKIAEPGAPPNGGPTMPVGNSGVTEGPPSVS